MSTTAMIAPLIRILLGGNYKVNSDTGHKKLSCFNRIQTVCGKYQATYPTRIIALF
jgi:hypothetical protein